MELETAIDIELRIVINKLDTIMEIRFKHCHRHRVKHRHRHGYSSSNGNEIPKAVSSTLS